MAVETNTQVDEIAGRKGYENRVADAEDISGGVEHAIGNVPAFSLWLSVGGAIDITVEASPDGGATWYELPESQITFSGAADDVKHISYNMNRIRLTGSDATAVTAQIREVM